MNDIFLWNFDFD